MLVGGLRIHHHQLRDDLNGTRDSNGCLICTNTTPSCSCSINQQCVIVNRDCDQCPYASCIDPDTAGSSTTSSGGVSKGAVAGAVVAIILVLAATVAGFFWYRRRQRMRAAAAAADEPKPDVPARAEDVLQRPDPNEKSNSPPPQLDNIRIYSGNLQGTINLDPAASYAAQPQVSSGASIHSNPFEDNHSIQTTSTGTQSNVIPIALVAPGSVRSGATGSSQHEPQAQAANVRAHMNLDHVNISEDTINSGGSAFAPPVRPNADNRSSLMTTGSFSSEFLETSVIVTPTRGTVKQVVGVAKAEVMRAPSSDTLSRSSTLTRGARSPLAASSFGPADVMQEADEEQEVTVNQNPFSDGNSPFSGGSPTPSATTFGSPNPSYTHSQRTDSRGDASWLQEDPAHLYGNDERPASVYTQASAIVADISNARRVHLGFDQITHMPQTPLSAALSTPRTPYRMTSAKLVSPLTNQSAAIQTGSSAAAGHLEAQQARALRELHTDSGKRISMSSVMTTSTRADSILESFPFVPPSPISNLPPRTPPRSPLAQQSFANGMDEHSQSAREMVNRARASASSASTLGALAPPNRKVLGMSVASQSSTASNGLGSFHFQIESGAPAETTSVAPSSFNNKNDAAAGQRKRASLDTLALTSDLSSYPLGFDKSPVPPVPRR